MIEANPAKRLTPAAMRRHRLFRGFDWVAFENGTMPNPLVGLA